MLHCLFVTAPCVLAIKVFPLTQRAVSIADGFRCGISMLNITSGPSEWVNAYAFICLNYEIYSTA